MFPQTHLMGRIKSTSFDHAPCDGAACMPYVLFSFPKFIDSLALALWFTAVTATNANCTLSNRLLCMPTSFEQVALLLVDDNVVLTTVTV